MGEVLYGYLSCCTRFGVDDFFFFLYALFETRGTGAPNIVVYGVLFNCCGCFSLYFTTGWLVATTKSGTIFDADVTRPTEGRRTDDTFGLGHITTSICYPRAGSIDSPMNRFAGELSFA